jgi:hypothetical protein
VKKFGSKFMKHPNRMSSSIHTDYRKKSHFPVGENRGSVNASPEASASHSPLTIRAEILE